MAIRQAVIRQLLCVRLEHIFSTFIFTLLLQRKKKEKLAQVYKFCYIMTIFGHLIQTLQSPIGW